MHADAAIAALAALAHPSRVAIFRQLIAVEPHGANAGEIALALAIPAPTLSFHLKELARASLVASQQQGRFVRYRAGIDTMDALVAYLTAQCCDGRPELCTPPRARAARSARTQSATIPRRSTRA